MRRRRDGMASAVPRHLLDYRAEDWQGSAIERWRAWHEARKDHFATVPEAWPNLMELMVDSYAIRAELLGGDSHGEPTQ